MNILLFILYCGFGIAAVTILDTIGAIASRKLNFKYGRLIIPSLLLYILIAFISAKQFGMKGALYINALVGFYDGTIGFWLSIKLRAVGTGNEKVRNFLGISSAIYMIVVGIVFGLIGYSLA